MRTTRLPVRYARQVKLAWVAHAQTVAVAARPTQTSLCATCARLVDTARVVWCVIRAPTSSQLASHMAATRTISSRVWCALTALVRPACTTHARRARRALPVLVVCASRVSTRTVVASRWASTLQTASLVMHAWMARSRMPSTLVALSAALGLLVCMVHATVARAVLRRHRAGRSAWRATIRTSSIRPITAGRVLRALAVWRARRDAQQT
jgi:hypothetical protein